MQATVHSLCVAAPGPGSSTANGVAGPESHLLYSGDAARQVIVWDLSKPDLPQVDRQR
jgi:hypothetical protein